MATRDRSPETNEGPPALSQETEKALREMARLQRRVMRSFALTYAAKMAGALGLPTTTVGPVLTSAMHALDWEILTANEITRLCEMHDMPNEPTPTEKEMTAKTWQDKRAEADHQMTQERLARLRGETINRKEALQAFEDMGRQIRRQILTFATTAGQQLAPEIGVPSQVLIPALERAMRRLVDELQIAANDTLPPAPPNAAGDDQAIEKMIQDAGKTAPRITPEMLEAEIITEDYYVFPDSTLTICCLTLANGFTVTGESAAASPENFDRGIGQQIAYKNAREKIWPLMGFRLRDQLSARSSVVTAWAACEALEDEASAGLKNDGMSPYQTGFWKGQLLTAKSLRRQIPMTVGTERGTEND